MKKENGFSIVEIMVSMVILSIVILVLTNITIVSTLEHSAAQGSDIGAALAREKLTELKDPSTLAADGSDQVTRKGVSYTRRWTITGSEPALATVQVAWTRDGRVRSAEAAGYLELGNECQAIVPNDAPTDIVLKLDDGSVLTTSDDVDVPFGTPAGRKIAIIYGYDADTVDGDMLTYSLPVGAEDNDFFRISGDTLKSKQAFTVEDHSYTARLTVTDCAGNAIYRDFTIDIGSASNKPLIPNPQQLTVVENSAEGSVVGTLTADIADPDPSNITWYMTSSTFEVDVYSGEITIRSGAGSTVNYETFPTFSIPATASRDGEDSLFTVEISVTNVNEAPSDITLSGASVEQGAPGGTIVGILSVADPDNDPAHPEWSAHILTLVPHSNFYLEGSTIKVKSGASLSSSGESITVTATDDNGAGLSKTKTIPLSVTNAVPPVNCSGIPQFVVWNGSNSTTYYGGYNGATPSQVVYENKLWRGNSAYVSWFNYNGIPSERIEWDLVGACQ